MLGITADNYDDGSVNFGKPGKYLLIKKSNNWIGWCSNERNDDTAMPNGFYCGSGKKGRASRKNNIFRKNKFKYVTRNHNNWERVPVWRTGDIVVMIYDSDEGELSFELYPKIEDEEGNIVGNKEWSILDSYICNLPRDLTFYWFVGHDACAITDSGINVIKKWAYINPT